MAMNVCLVSAQMLEKSVRAIGVRPLVLWSSDDLLISGEIDVASHVAMQPGFSSVGAGGNSDACVSESAGPGKVSNTVGGGGAGGSFGGLGGDGGGTATNAAEGTTTQQPALPPALRGGCRGYPGGDSNVTPRDNGGAGGGAVYLMADTSISISGRINASGAGGEAAQVRAGGGGGGSGGMIGLDAPAITITGNLIALGGGGSSGGTSSGDGDPGQEPNVVSAPFNAGMAPITGCSGGATGGGGSLGDGEKAPNGKAGLGSCGGGGGGGGDGQIRAFGATPTINSPNIKPFIISP